MRNMRMDLRKLLIVVAVATALPTSLMASVVLKNPDAKPVPEHSQAQVADQQKLQGTTSEVGLVPKDTELPGGGGINDEAGAAAVVAGREHELGIKSDPLAENVVAQVSGDIKARKSSPAAKVGWGLGFLLIGVCLVAGVRQWTVREVADLKVETPKSVKW